MNILMRKSHRVALERILRELPPESRNPSAVHPVLQLLSEVCGNCLCEGFLSQNQECWIAPSVEDFVSIMSTWIIAVLRNQKFFSLTDLNQAIFEKLAGFNRKPFQKRPGSRLSAFLDEEKHTLQPLPVSACELATKKIATVQFYYHISIEKMN